MAKKICVIKTSLRLNSNSDQLADAFIQGAKESGNSVEEISLKDIDVMPVIDVPRRKNNTPVPISANMELLVSKAITQNFVPVIDDTETFIGMVKRRTIVEYCYEKMKK